MSKKSILRGSAPHEVSLQEGSRDARSKSRAKPSISTIFCPGIQVWPSPTSQVAVAVGATRRSTSSTQGRPQMTAASRQMMVAVTRAVGGTSDAVKSPVPTSSSSALCTSMRV